ASLARLSPSNFHRTTVAHIAYPSPPIPCCISTVARHLTTQPLVASKILDKILKYVQLDGLIDSILEQQEGGCMRAAVISERNVPPVVGDFREPEPQDGAVLINVDTAGLGGWDVLGAYRLGVEYPCVIRGEGVGRAPDGRRVYFGERSVAPFGAWAARTLVPTAEVWEVPDEVDDKTAISMGIAATGAIVPLEKAEIQKGEKVLILGATGTLGQIALQLARSMGAGKVVGAARSAEALIGLKSRGIADEIVTLGGTDDGGALKDAACGGL